MNKTNVFKKFAIFSLACLIFGMSGMPALATTFTVNRLDSGSDGNCGDGNCEIGGHPGYCTLRAAIEELTCLAGSNDTIDFDNSAIITNHGAGPWDYVPGATMTVGVGGLTIDFSDLASGLNITTSTASGGVIPLMDIQAQDFSMGRTTGTGVVTFTHHISSVGNVNCIEVTAGNGRAVGFDNIYTGAKSDGSVPLGACDYNGINVTSGNLTIEDSSIVESGNNGIYNEGGALAVTGCLVGTLGSSDNGNGSSGVYHNSIATATISDSVVSGNDLDGLRTASTASLTVTGSKIGTNQAGTSALANRNGIAFNSGGTLNVSNSIISGNNQDGIYVNANGATANIDNVWIGVNDSSTKISNVGNGINIVQGTDITITDSQIKENEASGILSEASISNIQRNSISGNDEHGVVLGGNDQLAANNMIYSNSLIGLNIYGDDNTAILNTLVNNHGDPTGGVIEIGIGIDGATTNATVGDNVIQSSRDNAYGFSVDSGATGELTSDNNDIYLTGASTYFGDWGGTDYDLSGWQTNTSQDASSLTSDPEISLSSNGYALSGTSTVIDQAAAPTTFGVSLSEVNTDFYGDSRPGGSGWDMGADEQDGDPPGPGGVPEFTVLTLMIALISGAGVVFLIKKMQNNNNLAGF